MYQEKHQHRWTGAGALSKHLMEIQGDLGGIAQVAEGSTKGIRSYIGSVHLARFVRWFFHLDQFDPDTRWCSQRNEGLAPPFIIEDVLQDTSTAPYPCNHAPRSMKPDDILVKEFHDMTSVYCYNFRDESLSAETTADSRSDEGACVKHIFTGPYENLKVQATRLFLQIQKGIELSWQGVATGIAEGISTRLTRCFCLTALPVPHTSPTPPRPVLLLDITPSRLGGQ